jgi:hypothetical protein
LGECGDASRYSDSFSTSWPMTARSLPAAAAIRAATQEKRSLRARYQLVDLANGAVVLDATSGSDAGIDIVGSEYATVAAEQTVVEQLSDQVADQIVARLALYAARTTRPALTAP